MTLWWEQTQIGRGLASWLDWRLIVVPMRDNALPIGHNPVLFDVLRDLFGE